MSEEVPAFIQRALAAMASAEALMATPRPECEPWVGPTEPRAPTEARRSVREAPVQPPADRPPPAVTLDVLREFARMTGKEFRSLLDERLIRLSLMEQRLAEVEARLAEAEARL